MDTDVWCVFHALYVLKASSFDKIKVLFGVLRGEALVRLKVEQVLGSVVLVVIVDRQIVFKMRLIDAQACLVGPASRDILDGISASAKDHGGQAPVLDEPHAFTMSFDRCVVRANLVTCKGIGTAL